MPRKVLLWTTDPQLFLLLRHVLSTEGFETELLARQFDPTFCGTANEPVAFISAGMPDCAASRQLYSEFRKICPAVPIVLLMKPDGDQSGSPKQIDFFLKHPFDPVLLLNFLKRRRADIANLCEGDVATVLTYCDLMINRRQIKVFRNGHRIDLTPLQFRLLERLMQTPEAVCTRDELISSAWKIGDDVDPRTVDIHIGHLRKALARFGSNLIRTVQAQGYALDREAPDLR